MVWRLRVRVRVRGRGRGRGRVRVRVRVRVVAMRASAASPRAPLPASFSCRASSGVITGERAPTLGDMGRAG